MEKHNRRSHLAPQLSPATQELLRGSDSPTALPSASPTPTSGEIPIGGGDVRSQIVSPREQVVNTINGVRSPTKNASASSASASLGRAGGSAFHPSLGRIMATSSIPKAQVVTSPESAERASSASVPTFSHSLPMRPAPLAGPLPPPPVPRKEEPKDGRRQATYPPQSNGGYGGYASGGYGSNGNGSSANY